MPMFMAHLHSSLCNHGIESCIYLFWLVYSPNYFRGGVSGYKDYCVACGCLLLLPYLFLDGFLHVSANFSAHCILGSHEIKKFG